MDTEKNRRLERVFLNRSDREYYDLEITEEHQKLYDQYVSGKLSDQEFEDGLKRIRVTNK
ncbi:hypothetical protein ACT43R_19420 (plasmid) [Acinetobacter baumannii]|jgi:hypothetical protein|uniref:hypothetical protein n=1 Tax=Acinetobacter baumannii TaxID=470 RepID=UPI0007184669|nr:hypothetical protein [Acinetobacter baumannii]KRW34227.1 hypothetical protein AO727_17880 [Acinetobacter baumannii]MBZ0370132.1 hypothetical protein [Acinetobacter baumannii]MDC4549234.1 hypothetical protein [Acinetobacter baumannii]MDN8361289.1 hypothetical protein [Acinetobacter baumannii]